MYLNYTDEYWAFDIEGDGLPSNKIWCAAAQNIHTGEEVSLVGEDQIKEWVYHHPRAILVGHNFIGYDAPTMNRLLGTKLGMTRIVDTMILSMLYSPSLDGGHSLEAWGKRLRYPKGDFNDFSHYSEEMLSYCQQDVRLTRRVYLELLRRINKEGFTDEGISLEHRAWQLTRKQQQDGFYFNVEEAHILYSKLREEENSVRDRILKIWPPSLEIVGEYKAALKKDGSPTANYLRHSEQFVRTDILPDGSYEVFDFVAFNIGSPDQRVEKLLELGWRPGPDELTPTGKPKPTAKGQLVPTLRAFVEDGTAGEGPSLIAKWIEVNARANMINTWIEAYNDDTHCIHGTLWLANTLRYRHSNPNTANIPAVRVINVLDEEGRKVLDSRGKEVTKPLLAEQGVWTYEARDLWTVRNVLSRRLVGVDAKGIQLRVLAHYLNNAAFTEAVLGGDPHSYNQSVGGFVSRAVAKTFIYAFLLGAGDAKVGQIIGGSQRDGREVKSRFITSFPGLKQLLDRLEGEINRTGRIKLCDGTPLLVTAPHTRLGYLLQGDESRIMKKAAILTAQEVRRRKLDVIKVCDIHDEHQYDTLLENVEEFSVDVLPTAFTRSGESFNYRLPIDCDVKTGLTWSETH